MVERGGASFQGLLRELRLRCLRELRGLRRVPIDPGVEVEGVEVEVLKGLRLRGGIIQRLRW